MTVTLIWPWTTGLGRSVPVGLVALGITSLGWTGLGEISPAQAQALTPVPAPSALSATGQGLSPSLQPFRPSGGGFSILMPPEPSLIEDTVTAEGESFAIQQFMAVDPQTDVAYLVGWVAPAAETAAAPAAQAMDATALAGFAQGFQAELGAEVLADQAIRLGGAEGHQFRLSTVIQGQTFSVTQRLYLHHNRLYHAAVLLPAAQSAGAQGDIEAFFDSLQLMP